MRRNHLKALRPPAADSFSDNMHAEAATISLRDKVIDRQRRTDFLKDASAAAAEGKLPTRRCAPTLHDAHHTAQ